MSEIIKREGISKADEEINGCTVRRYYERRSLISLIVYNQSGWKVGTYKTEAGALRAVARQG